MSTENKELGITIIGDVHLGASLKSGTKDPVTGIYSRLIDYQSTLIQTIEDAAKRSNVLVFTGDIFENRFPTMLQQQIFSNALYRAVSVGFKNIFIVVGNHDQQRTSSTTTLAYLKELNLPNIQVMEELTSIQIGSHCLYFLPYRDRRYLGVQTYEEGLSVIASQLSALRKKSTAPGMHICVGHMALEGTFFAEEDVELYTDNELMLPKSLFGQFDLTVMGHVHTPGVVSESPPIYYSGSMEKRGAYENHHKKYLTVFPDNQELEWFNEPCREFYELKIDCSGRQYGQGLMDAVLARTKLVAAPDGIIKTEIKILADDLTYFRSEAVLAKLQELSPNFVHPIVPVVISQRAVKTLVESTSDNETWVNYCRALELDSEILHAGLEFVTEVE
jgi:exonuclease SbcD